MTAKLALAAATLVLAAGCASTAPATTAASGGATYYCWKDRLAADGENLVCNWEASASEACRSTGVTTISKGAVARGPDNASLCANGQWLVAVTTR